MTSHEELEQLVISTRRLKRHRAAVAELETIRDAEIAQAKAWFDDASHGERLEIERLTNEVEQWAIAHRTDKVKSWTTPTAKIATRPKKGTTTIVDDAVFQEWCAQNGYLGQPKPPAPDVASLRAAADVVDGALVVLGEVVPGVVVEGADEVSVTVTTL